MRRKFLIGLIAVSLSGCAFRPELERVAIDYNEMTANTANELILLNIVRAMHRDPMHFTIVTGYKNSVTASISGEVSATLPSQPGFSVTTPNSSTGIVSTTKALTSDTSTPKFGASVNTVPSFDVAVLNKQEFQRGIMQPINLEYLNLLLQQGWPDDVISALLIEKIDFVVRKKFDQCSDGQRIGSIKNEPAPDAGVTNFGNIIKDLELASMVRQEPVELMTVATALKEKVMPTLEKFDGKLFDLSKPVEGEERKITRATSPKIILTFRKRLNDISIKNPSRFTFYEKMLKSCRGNSTPPKIDRVEDAEEGLAGAEGALVPRRIIFSDGSPSVVVDPQAVIRSTQGVLYFLGEYARADYAWRKDKNKPQPYKMISRRTDAVVDTERKLIDLQSGDGRAVARTSYRGDRWFLPLEAPESAESRSMQVLDLAQQLFNLQQTANEAPVARSVSIAP